MKTYFVDSFTNTRFKGNPAAICILENDVDSILMQEIANEIGFSETAFIKKIFKNKYSIRFFSPKKEIPICGHATLAASKIIFNSTKANSITFINIEKVELNITQVKGKIAMEFPVYNTIEYKIPNRMLVALGLKKVNEVRYNNENKIVLIEIDDTNKLAVLEPDFLALVKSTNDINGVLITAKSITEDFDFHYRYFWPWAGTNEDPVTGAVQTFLTGYWATKLNKNEFNAFQSSKRTGMMKTKIVDDKLIIYGDAIIVFEGEFKNV